MSAKDPVVEFIDARVLHADSVKSLSAARDRLSRVELRAVESNERFEEAAKALIRYLNLSISDVEVYSIQDVGP